MKGRTVLAAVVGFSLISGAWATEGGGGAYPNGAEGLMTGAVPPPGMYLVNYLLYYQADEIVDGHGDNVAPPDFDLKVAADVVRLINVTKVSVLGGNWAQHVFIPIMRVDVTAGGNQDDATGLGDVIVDPFILAWHKGDCHWAVGLDIFVPVGKYDKTEMANLGNNHWTFEPVLGFTYLNLMGIEVSAKLMYDINIENPDTDYRSGQEFHTDIAVAKHLGNWTVGAGGFFYQQTTDDRNASGADVDAKGKQIGVGPQLAYQRGPMSFVLAADFEMETENKAEGERFWFKFVTPL
jgi:hypothetical protein